MSYAGRYPGGASPSYASAQLPGGGGGGGGGYYTAQTAPHSPVPQPAYSQAPVPYAQSYSPQPGAHGGQQLPPSAQNSQAAIQPGAITYTTEMQQDGTLIYHPFKCVSHISCRLIDANLHP
jgi:hypothetical protein